MDMMDIRRRMMGDSFPNDFIFKEGKGFRKDIEYFFCLQSSDKCYVSDDVIYMEGTYDGSAGEHSTMYIGAGLVWQNEYLRGNVIDTKGYTKLKIDAYINATNTRNMYFAILNNGRLSENAFGTIPDSSRFGVLIPPEDDEEDYFAYKDAMDISGAPSTAGRYTAEFDITGTDGIILNFWSPDFSYSLGLCIEIYNIWLE